MIGSKFMKKLLEKIMKGEVKFLFPTEMHNRTVEDEDFTGLPGSEDHADPEKAREWTNRILSELTREEKFSLISGYKDLAVAPVPRLGLPSVWSSDASSGIRCFAGGTAFPAGIALAATWNPEVLARIGETIAEEARARGISILLGPGINIYRVPTNGRNFEYLGEDPYLAGKLAAAYIRGAQERGVITTVKHFACNNSEYDRHKADSVVDERTLREIYLPAFKTAVTQGGSRGVMSAYNPVNGVYAGENRHLLTEILREEWGFTGFVMSDWDSLYGTAGPVKNGLSIEMPKAKWLTREKIEAEIKAGTIEESDIDRMAGELLFTFYLFGIYSRPQIDKTALPSGEAHSLAALEAAREGIVLLKNDKGALPFTPGEVKTIVVMGRTALDTATGGGGSSHVITSRGEDILSGLLAEGDTENSGFHIFYIHYKKNILSRKDRDLISGADRVVLCAGFHSHEETECFERPWELPENQAGLIRKTTALNPRTVVVLTAGGGVETESWIDGTAGLVHSFYLGESRGQAVAEILSGRVNPSGKLPFTMARGWHDFASTAAYVKIPHSFSAQRVFIGQGNPRKRKVWPMPYTEKLAVGYRHFDKANIEPRFPFGHGLSYTDFSLENLKIHSPLLKNRENRKVTMTLTNTGTREGAQVVQLYIRDNEASLPRPEKELKGFIKVFLGPGESEKLTFTITPGDLAFFHDGQNRWITEPGEFTVLAGFSSRDIRLEGSFQIK